MNCMPSGHSLKSAPHILGVVAPPLLAAPLARAAVPGSGVGGSSSDAVHRVEGVEGHTHAVESKDRGPGTRTPDSSPAS
jgi:hypothetical protein